MSNIFNNELRTALRLAHNLIEAGDSETAAEICINCVRDAAKHGNKDILIFFYGNNVYKDLNSALDAAKYIFIANCARDAYTAIEPLGIAAGTDKPWAIPSNDQSDEKMCEVFEWLAVKERSLEEDDFKYFNILVKAAKNRNKIHFKMTEKLKRMKLIDIIHSVISGTRGIYGGELR